MSGVRRLTERLEAANLVFIDARVLAFHLMAAPTYLDLTRSLFGGLNEGRIRGQVSALSFYQLFTEPYRAGRESKVRELSKILTVHPGLQVLPVTPEVATQAAQVRAQLGGGTERAIQIGSALVGGADVFLSESSGLRRIVGTQVANLEDYL